jgi:hypothetical protein
MKVSLGPPTPEFPKGRPNTDAIDYYLLELGMDGQPSRVISEKMSYEQLHRYAGLRFAAKIKKQTAMLDANNGYLLEADRARQKRLLEEATVLANADPVVKNIAHGKFGNFKKYFKKSSKSIPVYPLKRQDNITKVTVTPLTYEQLMQSVLPPQKVCPPPISTDFLNIKPIPHDINHEIFDPVEERVAHSIDCVPHSPSSFHTADSHPPSTFEPTRAVPQFEPTIPYYQAYEFDVRDETMEQRCARLRQETLNTLEAREKGFVYYMADQLSLSLEDTRQTFLYGGRILYEKTEDFWKRHCKLHFSKIHETATLICGTITDWIVNNPVKSAIIAITVAVTISSYVIPLFLSPFLAHSGETNKVPLVARAVPKTLEAFTVTNLTQNVAHGLGYHIGARDVANKIGRKCMFNVDLKGFDPLLSMPDETLSDSTRMLFVGGTLAICSNHCYSVCEGHYLKGHVNLKLTLTSTNGKLVFEVFYRNVRDHIHHVPNTPKDLNWWNFPEGCGILPRPDLSDLFIKSNSVLLTGSFYAAIYLYRDNGWDSVLTRGTWSGPTTYMAGMVRYDLENTALFPIATSAGDCLSPAIACDTRESEPHIIGLEIFGDGKQCGIIPITHELVVKVIAALKIQCYGKETVNSIINEPIIADNVAHCSVEGFNIVGFAKPVPSSTKNPIKEGPLYDKLVKYRTKYPNWLSEENLNAARAKYRPRQVAIDSDMLDMATNSFIKNLHERIDHTDIDISRCTPQESFTGIPGLLRPMNKNSSCGYPWNTMGHKQKKTAFGSLPGYDFSSEVADSVLESVLQLVDDLELGRVPEITYADFGKYETLALEKYLIKNRMVSGAPMQAVAAIRMLLGKILHALSLQPVNSGTGVGINVYSLTWDYLVKFINIFPGKIIAGDHSNWDGMVHAAVIMMVYRVFESFCLLSPQKDMDARKTYFRQFANSKHLASVRVLPSEPIWMEFCRLFPEEASKAKPGKDGKFPLGIIYEFIGRVSSGDVLTAQLNSFDHQIELRYCFAYILLDGKPYTPGSIDWTMVERNHRAVTYGDDIICSIGPELEALGVNQESLTKAFLVCFGRKFTDELKGDRVHTFRSLEYNTVEDQTCVSFLQRFMRYEPRLGRYVAPLRKSSIYNSLLYVDGVVDMASYKDTIRMAILDLSLYGEEVFNVEGIELMFIAESTIEGFTMVERSWKECIKAACDLKTYHL